ncbi:MAG: YfcC family protein, partial [Calditrichaeota bacterium]|nr:YfcC family protein [Calditrichota bacterium]
GSGQAALTMPVMAPLSDLLGVTRQTAVLAFQFGDGFSNMIIPTSGVTMAVLGMGKIPWDRWAKWLLPLEIIFFVIGMLLLIPPILMKWGPF